MAARESPRRLEEEREKAERVPAPLPEGLVRSYRGPCGGGRSVGELPLIGLPRSPC
jgi:hypothetical protein